MTVCYNPTVVVGITCRLLRLSIHTVNIVVDSLKLVSKI